MSSPARKALRFAAALLILAAGSFSPAFAQTFSGLMSGSWWDASRAGEGQFITFETVGARNVVYLAYFTYDANGAATWQVGNVDYQPGVASIAIPLITGSGPRFGAAFRTADLTTMSAGTATLEFVSCNQMRMRHSGIAGLTLNLTRLVGPIAGHPCSDTAPAALKLSDLSPFAAGCGVEGGTLYVNAEVEPSLAAGPANPSHLLAMWQQDRWSNGSSRGLVLAVSRDGGASWVNRPLAFSTCAGGTPGNGGSYVRASDPWVSIGPDGTAWAMSLSTNGTAFSAGSTNAMLVARSADGGLTWGNAIPLISDTAPFFNDKNAFLADPRDPRYAYAVWDRLRDTGHGPATFARTTDGGLTWEPARTILDPGPTSQTVGNLVFVLGDGTLVNLTTRIDRPAGGALTATFVAIRSADRGESWSAPVTIASNLAIGASDPETGTKIRDGAILFSAATGSGNALHLVWQDARFSGGARDAIAYSRSADGGLTWTAPARVNPLPAATAFTPTVHVLANGTIGITYFDLRDNTADPATLLTGYWLARSTDGVNWTETRLAGPFDLSTAANANGLFLGDYMGLTGSGSTFLSLFARTTGTVANRSDIFFLQVPAGATALAQGKTVSPTGAWPESWKAAPAAPGETGFAWSSRTNDAIGRTLAARGRPQPPP